MAKAQTTKGKDRLYKLIKATRPKFIAKEHEYPNPFIPTTHGALISIVELDNGRRIAIEIDGKVGHRLKKAKDKREAKKRYLELQRIELFAFPTPWVISKRSNYPTELFLEELHLK